MRKLALGVSALLITLTFGACSIASTYEHPVTPMVDSWSGAAAQRQDAAIDTLDWKSFVVGAKLRRLVSMTLGDNRSLHQTLLDIEATRVQYRIQRADRVPDLNAVATGNRQRQPANLSAGNYSGVASSYQVGLTLPEYELDLFGRVKNLTDTALQQYLVSGETTCAARIALAAGISRAYLSYDDVPQRLALIRQTLVSREYSFALIDQRRTASATTALDYQEALGLVE